MIPCFSRLRGLQFLVCTLSARPPLQALWLASLPNKFRLRAKQKAALATMSVWGRAGLLMLACHVANADVCTLESAAVVALLAADTGCSSGTYNEGLCTWCAQYKAGTLGSGCWAGKYAQPSMHSCADIPGCPRLCFDACAIPHDCDTCGVTRCVSSVAATGSSEDGGGGVVVPPLGACYDISATGSNAGAQGRYTPRAVVVAGLVTGDESNYDQAGGSWVLERHGGDGHGQGHHYWIVAPSSSAAALWGTGGFAYINSADHLPDSPCAASPSDPSCRFPSYSDCSVPHWAPCDASVVVSDCASPASSAPPPASSAPPSLVGISLGAVAVVLLFVVAIVIVFRRVAAARVAAKAPRASK
jgi:hypothetical protein